MHLSTLLGITNSLHLYDAEQTIYAQKPWTPDSVAIVAIEPVQGGLPTEAKQHSLDYFLEVAIASEFLQDWAATQSPRITPADACIRIIQYAENDA